MSRRCMQSIVSITALACAIASATQALAQAPSQAESQAGIASSRPTGTTMSPSTQDKATAADDMAGDIIVTAQRREESLSRVGISITAVGATALEDRGVKTLSDLVKLVPGLQASQTYAGNPIYTLRGIGFNTRNASATVPVGLYQNEAAIAYPYMTLGLLYDLERVEVVKGPQGTLYGRNATGGLVNYVTARPSSMPSSGATFEVGNYQTINASGFVSGPLTDWMRVRLAFNVTNRGKGYQRSVTRGDELGELYSKAVRLTLDLGQSDSPFSMTLTGDYWKRDGDTTGQQAIAYIPDLPGSPLAAFGNAAARSSIQPNPRNVRDVDFPSVSNQFAASKRTYPGLLTDSQFYSGQAKIGYAVSGTVRVQSLTSYQHLDQRDVADAAGLASISVVQDLRNDISSFSQELRLIGESDRFNWSVGGYYADDDVYTPEFAFFAQNAVGTRLRAIGQQARAANPANPYTASQIANSFFNFRNVSSQQSNVYAGFANADYKFNDLLKVTVGGRYTRDKTRFNGCTYDTDGGSVPLVNTVFPLFRVRSNAQGIATLNPNECYTLTPIPGANPAVAGSPLFEFVRTTIDNRISQDNFAFRANVDLTPSSRTLFYASLSRGYKSGVFPVVAGSSVSQFNAVQQEKLTAYEIGSKITFPVPRMQLNIAAFYYDYKDRQVFGRVLDPIFTTLSAIRNVPKSREFGVEGELTWRVLPVLTARISATYLDSKVLEFSDFTELGVAADIRGQPFTYTPKLTMTGGLSLDAPVSGDTNLIADASVYHQSRSQSDSAGLPLFAIDSYELVDGSIGFRNLANTVRVSLYGQNLFDSYYWVGVASGTDSVFRFPGMPRTYGIRAAFKF